MDENEADRVRVIAWTPVPPPVHGASVVGEAVCSYLEDSGCEVYNAREMSRRYVPRWAGKAIGGLLAMALMTRCKVRGERCLMYVSVAGGLGRLYEVPLLGVARMLGARIVCHHHSFSYMDKPDWLGHLVVRFAGRGAGHVVLCTRMGELLRLHYGPLMQDQDLHVIGNAAWVRVIDLSRVSRGPAEGEPLRLGFLGNITLEKGVDTFLGVIDDLRKNGFECIGVIAGPVACRGAGRALEEAQQAGLPIEVVGAVYGERKRKFFAGIDVLLFPSRYANEAAPLTVYEAASAGVPVIASTVGCLPSMRSREGVVTSVAEESDFGRAVRHLLAERPNHEALGRLREEQRESFRVARSSALRQTRRVFNEVGQPGMGK